MQTQDQSGDTKWPLVAIECAAVTDTRGQRIRQERQRRRMSQQDLAGAVGVSVRTISRIETDAVVDPSTLPAVEDYLDIGRPGAAGVVGDTEATERAAEEQARRNAAAHADIEARISRGRRSASDNPRVRDATVWQLLAELASRFSQLDALLQEPTRTSASPPERVRWYTEDAPEAPGGQGQGHGEEAL